MGTPCMLAELPLELAFVTTICPHIPSKSILQDSNMPLPGAIRDIFAFVKQQVCLSAV